MNKKENRERKLTEAEKIRLEAFTEQVAALEKDGYVKTDLTVSADKANIIGPLYGFLTALPFIVLYFLINPQPLFWGKLGFLRTTLLVIFYFILVILHELIHGLTWSRFTKKGFRSISFGVIWRSLNPYCTCSEPLSKIHYMTGLLMPWFVLGILPCIAALIIPSGFLLFIGVIMVLSAGGDLLIAQMMLARKSDGELLFLDHPTDIGLVCLEKKQQ